jgi:hypothetical protein
MAVQSTTAKGIEGEARWRELDREGCEHGRLLAQRVGTLEKGFEDVNKKLDRLIWLAAGAAISLGTSAFLLALNLLFK